MKVVRKMKRQKLLFLQYINKENNELRDPRRQRPYSGTGHTHLGRAEAAVDQDIVDAAVDDERRQGEDERDSDDAGAMWRM